MQFNISTQSLSAVVPETEYSWNTYTSAAAFGVLFRGKEVMITKDTKFGLRDGTKGSARLILVGEPTKVITVSPEERTVLLARSTPAVAKGRKRAETGVPEFDAAATWKKDIVPAIKTASERLSNVKGPSTELTYYLNHIAKSIGAYEDKATAAAASNVVAQINNKIDINKGTIDVSKPLGQLASLLMDTSKEWKRVSTGKLKYAKAGDAYNAMTDFRIAAAHMRLAQLMVGGRVATVLKAFADLDTSVRDSLPAKVSGALVRLNQAKGPRR